MKISGEMGVYWGAQKMVQKRVQKMGKNSRKFLEKNVLKSDDIFEVKIS
jgi:hypothetical protein